VLVALWAAAAAEVAVCSDPSERMMTVWIFFGSEECGAGTAGGGKNGAVSAGAAPTGGGAEAASAIGTAGRICAVSGGS
jgi:hypothetical protein